MTIYITVLLSCNLFEAGKALKLTSYAVEDYISATDRIPQNAVFVRILFPTPKTSEQYGLARMGRDPLFHLDAYSAARRGSVDLSDFEALNPIFPLALRPRIGEGQRLTLWSFEGPNEEVAKSLASLRQTLAIPIDYVVVVSDGDSAERNVPGLDTLRASLDTEAALFAASPHSFVQVYKLVR